MPRRRAPNVAWNFAAWSVPVLLAFVATPLTVMWLGVEEYGVLTLASTVILFSGALDLGLGEAAVKYVAQFSAQGDRAGVNCAISAAVLVHCAYGALGGLLIWLAAGTLAGGLFSIPDRLMPQSVAAFQWAGVGYAVAMISGVLSSVPRGLQRFDLSTSVRLVFGSASTLLRLGLLWAGLGLVEVVAAQVLMSASAQVVMLVIIRRLVPTFRWTGAVSLQLVRDMVGFGGFKLLGTLGNVATQKLPVLLLGRLGGPEAVAYFAVPSNIAVTIQTAGWQTLYAVFPRTTELLATGRREALRETFSRNLARGAVLVAALGVGLAAFAPEFMAAWMGSEFGARSGGVLALLALGFCASGLSMVPYHVLMGAGRARATAAIGAAGGLLSTALALVAIPWAGASGAALAMLAAYALVALLSLAFAARLLDAHLGSTLARGIVAPLAPALAVALAARFIAAPFLTGLAPVVTAGAAAATAYLVVAWRLAIVHPDDIRRLRAMALGSRAGVPSPD